MKMVNTTYNSTEDMNNKLQELKSKSKLKIYKNICNYYDEMNYKNFQTQEVPFSKNARGISKIYHEVMLLMKYLQNKPQVKNMNTNYYDFYYTVIKNGDEKENVDNRYQNDYINLNDFIIPNHKSRETILR